MKKIIALTYSAIETKVLITLTGCLFFLFIFTNAQSQIFLTRPDTSKCSVAKAKNLIKNGDFGNVSSIGGTATGNAPNSFLGSNLLAGNNDFSFNDTSSAKGAFGNFLIINTTKGMSRIGRRDTIGIPDSSWITTKDSSFDQDGYFMAVSPYDTSMKGAIIFRQDLNSVCQNTTYTFSFDYINLLKSGIAGISPHISLVVAPLGTSATILRTFKVVLDSTNIPQDQRWHRLSINVVIPSGTSGLTIALRNDTIGNFGNDYGIDNIHLSACIPDLQIPEAVPFCAGQDIHLEAKNTGNLLNGPEFQWQRKIAGSWQNITGNNKPTFDIKGAILSDSGEYKVVSAGQGNMAFNECIASDSTNLIYVCSKQQLCSGVLDTPLILKTFGSGTSVYSLKTPIDFGFSTTYKQVYTSTTEDGQFSIMNNPNQDHGTWIQGEDHTQGDVNGYMLLVNADYKPGEFYRDTVSNLCIGSTYEFSAWAANIMKVAGIKPKIRFEIRTVSGSLLTSYSTIELEPSPVMNWVKYGMSFTVPNTSIILLMISDAPGGGGNDLVIDDISFSACKPVVTISDPVAGVCENENITLSVNVQGNSDFRYYRWQNSKDKGTTWLDKGSFVIQNTDLTNYNAVLTMNNLQTAEDSLMYRIIVSTSSVNVLNASTTCNVFSKPSLLKVNPKPTLVIKNPMPVCNTNFIDLGENSITKGSKLFKGTLKYFHTISDAGTGLNPIPSDSIKKIKESAGYFVKVETPTTPACSDIKPVNVIVHKTPELVINQPVSVCSPLTIDFTSPAIISGSNLYGANLTYYSSSKNALNELSSYSGSQLSPLIKRDTIYLRAATSTSPVCLKIDSVIININETPQLNIMDPLPVCLPKFVDITADSLFKGSDFLGNKKQYYRSIADTINEINKINPVELTKLKQNGIYFVRVVNPGVPYCSVTKKIQAVVFTPPKASFSGLDTMYCQNIPASVILSGTPAGGIFSGTGINVDNFQPSVIGSYPIKYKVKDNNNCVDSISKNVTVHPNPFPDFTGLGPFYCTSDSTLTLKGIPSGGTFSGSDFSGSRLSMKKPGNFNIIYSFTDAFGCKDNVSKNVNLVLTTYKTLPLTDTLICFGSSFLKRSTVVADKYYWDPIGKTSNFIFETPKKSMNYTLFAQSAANCSTFRGSFKVEVIPTPPFPLAPGPIIHCLQEQPLEINPLWGNSFQWSDGSNGTKYKVLDYGTISLKAFDKHGCSNENSVEITDNCPPLFLVPNGFSPNGDGENDVMGIFGRNFTSLKLMVFNRWGEIIYFTNDRSKPWDGTYRGENMPVGVYNWQASYDSTIEKDKNNPRKTSGSITLIR